MKLILLLLTIAVGLYGEDIHPNIKTKYMVEKGFEDSWSILDEYIEVKESEIRFRFTKNDNEEDAIEMYIWDSIDEREESISYFSEGTKILSLFFENITDNELREMFVLTKNEGNYEIYSFRFEDHSMNDGFIRNKYFDENLNEKFKDYGDGLNASIIRNEIKGKYLFDYQPVSFNRKKEYFDGKALGFYKFDETNGFYEKRSEEDVVDSYILKFEDNIFAIYKRTFINSFSLNELFQGKVIKDGDKISFVKNGRYKYTTSNDIIMGSYKNNLKEGEWVYHLYRDYSGGSYKNGKRVGYWYENYYTGLYEDGLKQGWWISDNESEKQYYEDGRLKSAEYSFGDRRSYYEYNENQVILTIYNQEKIIEYEVSGEGVDYEKKEYDENERLIYYTGKDKLRRKIENYQESSTIVSNFVDTNWNELEYLGAVLTGFQGSTGYELNSESNWFRIRIFMKKEEDKNIYFIYSYSDDNNYYFLQEVFEGYEVEGKFPQNIIKEGRAEILSGANLSSTGNNINNKASGNWKTYFYEGFLWIESEYKDGLKHGRFIKYDKDGNIVEKIQFRNDKRTKLPW